LQERAARARIGPIGLVGLLERRSPSFNSNGLNPPPGHDVRKMPAQRRDRHQPPPFTSHVSRSDPGRFRINAGAEIAEENEIFYLARVLERDSGSGSGLGTEHFVVG